MDNALLILLIASLATYFLSLAYDRGHRAGFRAALKTDPPSEIPLPPAHLEIIEERDSGNILWRFGPGHTLVTGYCHKHYYPAQALEKVATHLDTQRHEQAVDQLLDQYLS